MSAGRRVPLDRGDVVLVHFPFTDLSGTKLRPALIVGRVQGDDVILAFMTSRTAAGARGAGSGSTADGSAAHPLTARDSEFGQTGLKGPALIRLDKIATIHRHLVQRRLGQIGPRTEHAVAQSLRHVFML